MFNQEPNNDYTMIVRQTPEGELTTTSLVIAEGTQVQHKNVLELLRKNQPDFEEFGPLTFETRKGSPLPQNTRVYQD